MKFVKPCFVAVLLAGCATPQSLISTGPSAELSINLQSNSYGGALGQHWTAWKFNDATCQTEEKGVLVARKRRGKPLDPIRLPVDKPITLTFWYIEANFAQNRECSYTWTFAPSAGEKYAANLMVSPAVSCSVALTDASGLAVYMTTPVNSCVVGLLGRKIGNGEPATITYRASTY